MAIKSKTNSLTFTGGATYDAVTDPTIKRFTMLQFDNNTGSDIKVKFNSDSTYRTYADGEPFTKGEGGGKSEYKDVVYANGTGTIIIEIEYDDYT